MKRTIFLTAVLITVLPVCVLANSAPVVSNVTAAQRDDNSKLVDIHYDLADADGDYCTVWILVSDNDGVSWSVPAMTLTGHIGHDIAPGNSKHIVWDAGTDMPGRVGTYKVRVFTDDGQGPTDMVLVPAGAYLPQNNQPPIFVNSFLIDKYEVTNQFYCQFLNNAASDGSHWNSNMEISQIGNSAPYYYTIIPGKENYPIRWVRYEDAVAFAQWRSNLEGAIYHLPTGQEWEKAAAWDPAQQYYYTYGFHRDSIDCTWCNYGTCIGNVMPVGSYNGTGGRNNAKSYYGCYDMSGNVSEWTKQLCYSEYGCMYWRCRGGAIGDNENSCTTSTYICQNTNCFAPVGFPYIGFRLVKEVE
jgi:hypothetical protein